MPKSLLPKELCRYRIADQEFVINECLLEPQTVLDFCREPMHKCEHDPAGDVAQWAAYRVKDEKADDLVAYGWICPASGTVIVAAVAAAPDGSIVEVADIREVGVLVHWEFRNQGLGTIMFQQAPGLAKTRKIKELWTVVPRGKGIGHLGRDGYDFTEQGSGEKVGRMGL